MIYLIKWATSVLFPSPWRMQQASQWWHDRQSRYLQEQAEQIRDGLLQNLLTIRRNLELYPVEEGRSWSENCQQWVTEIEQIHRSLRHLSDQLFPSHFEERLPSAIRYELEGWKQQNPNLNLTLDLPTEWVNESPDHNRVMLMVLGELLRIALPHPINSTPQEPIQICLSAQNHEAELRISVSYPDSSTREKCCRSQELIYLTHAFQLLTSGWCTARYKGSTATWSFRWRLL